MIAFNKYYNKFNILSISLVVISLFLLLFKGLNFGIDFKGGSLIELRSSDPKINVLSQNVINEKYTIVSSVLVETNERPEIKIDWRVYTKDPSKPLIRDLIIEGLSLARTQKEEFNSVIQSNDGDIDALLNNLKEFINK